MRPLITIAIIVLFYVAAAVGQTNQILRAELLEMERVDQDARLKCTSLTADEQIKCLAAIKDSIDVPNTKRLEAIFSEYGFPTVAAVGKGGLQAFMIILQHAPTDDLRVKALKPITKAFKNKELLPMDYANFVDRLRLHQGKKQLYGTGFEFKDGKMVLNPTEDIKRLEKRRAKIGLPPMSEAVKMMKEMYHLEVVVPIK
jgi:hypothetical protein